MRQHDAIDKREYKFASSLSSFIVLRSFIQVHSRSLVPQDGTANWARRELGDALLGQKKKRRLCGV
jgi:hypothetical protein